MPSTTRSRRIRTVTVILAGVTAFAVGLVAILSSAPSPEVLAQGDCTQPSDAGCPLSLDATIQASLTDSTQTNNWLLNVQDSSDFTVNLVNQPGNYELWVYAPDNTLLGISSDDAIVDRKVQVTNQGVGNYWVVIKSHNGDSSANPYTLYSSTITAVTAIPISSYDATPVTRTGGYRTAP